MPLDAPLSFHSGPGSAPGTVIYSLDGPLTLRNLFELQAALREGAPPQHSILDLSGVPYMDSAGMGLLINYYVHCQNKGTKVTVVGVSARVLELFRMTRVDTVIPLAASVEAAQAA